MTLTNFSILWLAGAIGALFGVIFWHRFKDGEPEKEISYMFKVDENSPRKSFVFGVFLSSIFFPLFLSLTLTGAPMPNNASINFVRIIIYCLSSLGLLYIFFSTRKLRYYHQILLIQLVSFSLLASQFFFVGFWLIFSAGRNNSVKWIIGGCLIGFLLLFRRLRNEPLRWVLARQQGRLQYYLDEKNWTFKFEIPNTMEKQLGVMEKQDKKNSLITLLEKTHYLMPALGVTLSRNFPDQRTVIIGICLLTIGFLYSGQLHIPLLLKIRSWEDEKGKPLLLEEVWVEEYNVRPVQ